jgi:hypothetical protein
LTPQAKIVLAHLQAVGHISNVEANAVLKVRSVSRRITELQSYGHRVTKEHKKDSTGQRYVKYTLVPGQVLADNGGVILDFAKTLFRAADNVRRAA